MNEIVSAQNAKFKAWASLVESRGIKKAGRAVVSGKKLVDEFLEQNPEAAEDLLYPPKGDHPHEAPKHVKSYQLSSPLFKELDVMGTKSPLLIVKTPEIAKFKNEAPKDLCVIVPLSDPGNMGAMLRSAEAFGAAKIILTEESCSPFLPKAIRGSSGACFRLKIEHASTPLSEIQATPAFTLDMKGENIAGFKWPKNLYLILGEEGRGIPTSLAATSVSIPMRGKVESLNAVAAASIALYSYRLVY